MCHNFPELNPLARQGRLTIFFFKRASLGGGRGGGGGSDGWCGVAGRSVSPTEECAEPDTSDNATLFFSLKNVHVSHKPAVF